MKYLRERVLQREVLAGTWLNLGSNVTAEIAGRAGFDWLLIDLEHGSGDEAHLLGQLQAISATNAAPIVRIAWNEAPRVKRTLDLGPSGIMVPYVNTPEEARRAVAAMRYPPQGVRGAARFTRAAGFGQELDQYFAEANANLLTIVQIETPQAVAQVEEIAAIDGVDVLFVGPLDLSVSLGIPQQFTHPDFRAALQRVSEAARNANKAAGILLASADQIAPTVADGFTFLAVGSDGGMVAAGMKSLRAAFQTVQSAEKALSV
ncbi:MAG: 4-hydroxy-2-oxovalerate aldolase [Chthonomonadaceae bacterium]|nr:4-hydroxy-2-oxovalerate aldolase [Chthonomonadaceae bacterium]